jgi:hypothetical protein
MDQKDIPGGNGIFIAAENNKNIRIIGPTANGNQKDGIHIEGGEGISLENPLTSGNQGHGISVTQPAQAPPVADPWHKQPLGIIALGLTVTIIGGLIVAYLKRRKPSLLG